VIIQQSRAIRSSDIARFAWSSLRRFHNTAFVTIRLCEIHNIPSKQKSNAAKQADQIRYSLMQARDYFDSALEVSAATKPVLLYYCLMHLATAEVLFKQEGDSSLHRAREQHRHHGLSFALDVAAKRESTMIGAASKLAASRAMRKPARRQDNNKANKKNETNNNNYEGFGTFELWRRSARESPTVGRQEVTGDRNIVTYGILGIPPDKPSNIPAQRITLLDCLQHLPALHNFCWLHGLRSEMVRSTIRRSYNSSSMSGTFIMAIHPNHKAVYGDIIEHIFFKAELWGRIQFIDQGDSGTIICEYNQDYLPMFSLPSSANIYQDECFMNMTKTITNEFGYYYIALFICGNYARYYPDYWIVDIERSSDLSLAIDQIMHSAEERVPLLALSELERTYFVLER